MITIVNKDPLKKATINLKSILIRLVDRVLISNYAKRKLIRNISNFILRI